MDRNRGSAATESSEVVSEAACAHSVLLPRWDNVEDMGREERAVGFTCQACGETFGLAEGWDLQRMDAERRAQLIEEGTEDH